MEVSCRSLLLLLLVVNTKLAAAFSRVFGSSGNLVIKRDSELRSACIIGKRHIILVFFFVKTRFAVAFSRVLGQSGILLIRNFGERSH